MLFHSVFFTLKDRNPTAQAALIKSCQRYLTKHPGTAYFACGAREEGLARGINDHEFDVAVHIVFATRSDHDSYQVSPRHKQFLTENSETWSNIRVFDTAVEGPGQTDPGA